jgi:uncharacterized protein (UPF0332 family)
VAKVRAAFSEYFVKTGRIEAEYKDILKCVWRLCAEADYGDEFKELTPESAKQIIADAGKFVGRIEQYLREVGAIE